MLLRVWKQDVFGNYYGSVLSSQFYGKLGLNLMLDCLEGESYPLVYWKVVATFLAFLWASTLGVFRGILLVATDLCEDWRETLS